MIYNYQEKCEGIQSNYKLKCELIHNVIHLKGSHKPSMAWYQILKCTDFIVIITCKFDM